MKGFKLRKIKAIIAAVTLALVATTFTLVSSEQPVAAQTGGALIPCPGSPWGNGWFNNYNGSVNCSQQNNHIVVDAYDSNGVRTQAVMDIWYGDTCDRVIFIQPGPGGPFVINFENDTSSSNYNYGCSMHGVPVQLQYSTSTYVQWYDVGAPPYYSTVQQVNQCRTTTGGNCASLNGGFWTGRPHGINGGPHYRIHHTATGNFGTNVRTWDVNVYAERTDY